MNKILITGDRNWIAPKIDEPDFSGKNNEWLARREVMREALQALGSEFLPNELLIIHGAAPGVDRLAGQTAKLLNYAIKPYPAQWRIYGDGAGPRRNRQMVDENPDIVRCLAFHDDLIGSSKGTLHMVRYAKLKGIPVIIYKSDGSSSPFTGPTTTSKFGKYN